MIRVDDQELEEPEHVIQSVRVGVLTHEDESGHILGEGLALFTESPCLLSDGSIVLVDVLDDTSDYSELSLELFDNDLLSESIFINKLR